MKIMIFMIIIVDPFDHGDIDDTHNEHIINLSIIAYG